MTDRADLDLIRDAARAYAARSDGTRHLRVWRGRLPGFDRARWRDLAGLGWTATLVPETDGGAGLGFDACAAIVEALAAPGPPEPFVEVVVGAGRVIAGAGSGVLRSRLLAGLVDGSVLPALAWQEGDGGLDPAQIRASGETDAGALVLRGAKRFVVPGPGADGFIVAVRAPERLRLVWLDARAAGLRVEPEPRADGTFCARLVLDGVRCPADSTLAAGERAEALLARAVDEQCILTGVAQFGLLDRALALTMAYLGTRVQFGRPIGSFQALQHRAADLLVQKTLCRSLVDAAVALLDAPHAPEARAAMASRVKARLSDAAVQVGREAVQFHGGMGMADETDIGLYLHRALALGAWLGNAASHRRRWDRIERNGPRAPVAAGTGATAAAVAAPSSDALCAEPTRDWNGLPDDVFRAQCRAFFEAHYPKGLRYLPRRARWHEIRDWYRFQSARGVIAPGWPRAFGGMGLDPGKFTVFTEEQERFQLVRGGLEIGITMVGPLLIRYGTPEQQARYLPRILAGDDVWCQGYSEPGAGSDLAAVATVAERDGDHFVVTGQKTWTSMAHDASHMVTLVRTDRTAKKQAGISFLLIDLALPGIVRKPFRTITGEEEFCNVFLDGVRVPVSCLVGEPNGGWAIARSLLGFERVWIGSTKRSMTVVTRLAALAQAQGLDADPEFRAKFARLRLDVADLGTCYEAYVEAIRMGRPIGPDVSVLKIWATETFQRLSELAIEAAGDCGGLAGEFAIAGTAFNALAPFYEGRGATIGGGSSEIQRGILAREVLGLPSK